MLITCALHNYTCSYKSNGKNWYVNAHKSFLMLRFSMWVLHIHEWRHLKLNMAARDHTTTNRNILNKRKPACIFL